MVIQISSTDTDSVAFHTKVDDMYRNLYCMKYDMDFNGYMYNNNNKKKKHRCLMPLTQKCQGK